MDSRKLCTWCQENVFDRQTLTMIYPTERKGSYSKFDRSGEPFRKVTDASAHFSNRSYLPGYSRVFRQYKNTIDLNAISGCIFCMLLKHALYKHLHASQTKAELESKDILSSSSEADRDGPYFDFVFTIKDPWKWCTVAIGTDRDRVELSSHPCFFRLYPLSSRTEWLPEVRCYFPTQSGCSMDSLPSEALYADEIDAYIPKLERDGKALRAMIEECKSSHPDCVLPDVSVLPSFLLQVTGTIISPSVRLARVSNIAELPICYICLSYCWGGPQSEMTTVDRVDSYLENIDTTILSNTALDAIRVTISVGCKYLWIDAFCIVQDSVQLKNTELSKMASIFSGAFCTIYAMSSAKTSEGFLNSVQGGHQDSTETWHVGLIEAQNDKRAILEICSDFSEQNMPDCPLLVRAWTYQEALLSPRLIMFFARGQRPAMKCCTHTVRSDGGLVTQTPKSVVGLKELMNNVEETIKDRNHSNRFEILEQWVSIVGQYSHRSLTFDEDKLPALMSVASQWGSKFKPGSYCAGLWSNSLDLGLLWRVDTTSLLRAAYIPYVAPSWSWASRNHPIYYQYLGEVDQGDIPNEHFRVVGFEINPVYQDLPYGAVQSAKLTVECDAELVIVSNPEEQDPATTLLVKEGMIRFVFDDSPRPQDVRQVWLLYVHTEEPYNWWHPVGLGVVEVKDVDGNDTNEFRRVGFFSNAPQTLAWSKRRFTLV